MVFACIHCMLQYNVIIIVFSMQTTISWSFFPFSHLLVQAKIQIHAKAVYNYFQSGHIPPSGQGMPPPSKRQRWIAPSRIWRYHSRHSCWVGAGGCYIESPGKVVEVLPTDLCLLSWVTLGCFTITMIMIAADFQSAISMHGANPCHWSLILPVINYLVTKLMQWSLFVWHCKLCHNWLIWIPKHFFY